jgi:hypothetical protein
MKVTVQRLRWYDAIAEECRNIAQAYNEVTQEYGSDFYADSNINVYIEEGETLGIDGDYMTSCRGCHENQSFYLQVPFAFIEDPIAWQEQYEEEKHQKLLADIQAKIDKKKRDEEALETHERAEYERLKEKYGD